MRKASVDFGTKRSGIAFTDPSGKIVTTVKTVAPSKIVEELKKMTDLDEIVVGLPLNLKKQFTASTRHAVDKAIEISEEMAPLPVYMVDERFTSNIANREIISSGSKKKIVDELSASIILQDYMKGKINSYRVFNFIPKLSKEILTFFETLSPRKIVMIGEALRGLELQALCPYEIYEENPVYFRLREVNSKKMRQISLHFGVFWDIILSSLDKDDLLVCDSNQLNDRLVKRMPVGTLIVMENEKGSIKIGERSFDFLKVKSL